jgi:hypothetical protein
VPTHPNPKNETRRRRRIAEVRGELKKPCMNSIASKGQLTFLVIKLILLDLDEGSRSDGCWKQHLSKLVSLVYCLDEKQPGASPMIRIDEQKALTGVMACPCPGSPT